MNNNPFENFKEIIGQNSNFLIVSHINPEGDALGSELAMALTLEKLGKKVTIWNLDPVPEIYRFLPHSERIHHSKEIEGEYDILLLVDCGNFERTGLIEQEKIPAGEVFVVDHHLTESPLKEKGWINPDASSTGEMIYELINLLGVDIDKDIAVNLYTAILTDTGSFRYSSTNPRALKIAGDLVEKGVSPSEIAGNVYESLPFRKLKLLGLALRTAERSPDGRVAWITVSQRMFRLTESGPEDTDEFVNSLRAIKGVEVAIFFRQKGPEVFKISLRSKGRVDVARIAESMGGGGHKNAAGCELKGSLTSIKKKVVKTVEEAIEEKILSTKY